MRFKSFVLSGAAIVGLAFAGTPTIAFTHHPSTPEERAQTDQLNAQSLSQAQGTVAQQPAAQPMASNESNATASAETGNTASNATGATQTGAQASGSTVAASGTVALSAIENPPQTLANASVESSNGQAVGAVQRVVTGSDGKTQAVDVALLGAQGKIVAIDAQKLSYDQSRNVVVAQLSADQIQALPAAPQG
jgi:hypothetical protein